MKKTRLGALMIAVAAVCAATGCQDGGMDRTGGTTITLRLASIDGPDVYAQNAAPQAFVEALKTLSQGRINVELHQGYGNAATTAESSLSVASPLVRSTVAGLRRAPSRRPV